MKSSRAKPKQTDLLQGTLHLLILKAVSTGPLHGLAVSNRIAQITGGVFQVKPWSLFPALYRMEEQGLIEAEWRATENNRNAKFYALTRKGRRAAPAELDGWLRLSGAITRVLRALEQQPDGGGEARPRRELAFELAAALACQRVELGVAPRLGALPLRRNPALAFETILHGGLKDSLREMFRASHNSTVESFPIDQSMARLSKCL